ncbi:MAG TPA: hypothetical protein VGB50_04515 [Flavobacterium sp.]|jgi:hypothetical protein
MKNRNLLLGIAAGAALLSVALYLKRSGRLDSLTNSAGDMLDGIRNKISGGQGQENQNDTTGHGGRQLAQKARHKAEQMVAMHKNGQHS